MIIFDTNCSFMRRCDGNVCIIKRAVLFRLSVLFDVSFLSIPKVALTTATTTILKHKNSETANKLV